jgi:hypothetical protein
VLSVMPSQGNAKSAPPFLPNLEQVPNAEVPVWSRFRA